MATTEQYINQLKVDKQNLVNNLKEKGVEATDEETFTSLVPKIKNITYAPRYLYRPFYNYKGTELDEEIANLDISNLTDFSYMFYLCTNLQQLDLNKWNTSLVENMENMFNACRKLPQLDLSNWNTEKVTNMYGMFIDCGQLKQLDLSNWSTEKVTNMRSMFLRCNNLQQLDIRNFTFTKVTSYNDMFLNVPLDCKIIVNSDTERDWIKDKFPNLNNIVTVAELETENL